MASGQIRIEGNTVTRFSSLLAACLFLIVQSVMAAPSTDVLVLFSNNRLLPANIEVDRGLREVIAGSGDLKVEVFNEFLDEPTFSGQEYEQAVASYLSAKYANRPPQAIIAGSDEAVRFILRHRARLFPRVPVVHVGIGRSYLKSLQPLPADVVGVPVEYDSLGTIQLALRWHPAARRLVIVTGASGWDRAWESDLRAELASKEEGTTVEFLAGLSTAVVSKRLSELGRGDVVFTPGYFVDGAGRSFSPRESAALMATASSAPVYGPYSTFIGTGVVGGRVASYLEIGREAGREVTALLHGTTPAALKLPASIPAVVQVDWRQVRKWKIDPDRIPTEAIIHFREPTFWDAYRNELIIVASVMLLQAALIAALLVERRLRHRTASRLEESEARMKLAGRAARLSMWTWDITRHKVGTTSRLRQEDGLSKVSPIHFDHVLESVHPADREEFDRAVTQAVANDEELDIEYRMVQSGGEVRWIAARGRAEKGGADRLVGVALDVTSRKVAEVQAEKDRAALTHMTRVSMMGQLSAAIAHQLNQPLAAILGNAEAARKMLEREHLDLEELKEICDDIVAEDLRAAQVIRRLGALYKRGEMSIAPLDLNELVAETVDLVRTELMTRHVVAATDLAPLLPPVDGDRVQLQQIVLNLIINAADAMSDIAPAQRRLVLRTKLDDANVRLCVVDRGPGIEPEDMTRVFDAFWSTKAGGIGVGLAICKSIATAHHGTINVANNPDGGATFCVQWPTKWVYLA